MRRVLLCIMSVLIVAACRYDDSFLIDRMDDLELRVQSLEQLCQKMNTNISAIQSLVDALQRQDYIKTITPIKSGDKVIGYTISFAYGDPITIYHGADGKDGKDGADGNDGKDGYTPVIGVKMDVDGVYYWTLDGDWLVDEDGDKIRAVGKDGVNGKDGISPVLEIREGYWYISYDNGNTWACLGKAVGEDGSDGKNGYNGSDGEDGRDGKDGKDGDDGKDGITPRLKIEDGYWYVSYDNGNTWAQLGKATGDDGKDGAAGSDGADGEDGKDGVMPKLEIRDDYWYISYDDGNTWAQLGKATGKDGEAGADGDNGEDGITPKLEIRDGYWYISYDDGNTWAQLGKAAGEDGATGSSGTEGDKGDKGDKGDDGVTPQLKIEDDYWYVSYDNGVNWVLLGKATGEDGTDGKDGDAYFSDVIVGEEYVTFVLAESNETIIIPLYRGFSAALYFKDPAVNYVVVGDEDIALEYDVSNANGNLVIMVFSDLKTTVDKSACTITITAPSSIAGLDDVEAVTLLVSDGRSTAMASVDVAIKDFDPLTNEVPAQTAEDLLRWAYLINEKGYKDLGLTLKNDITFPAYTVEKDDVNETYSFTNVPITVTGGIPSGRNWFSICSGIQSLGDSYSGHINGCDKAIRGLRIIQSNDQVGFIGSMYGGASIKNIIIEEAVVKGNKETGVGVGRIQNDVVVENVHVIKSNVVATSRTGGVVGFNYRRFKTGVEESLTYVMNCTTDKETIVKGTNGETGGICGRNDGAVVIACENHASVSGTTSVGGIVGHTCSYNSGGVNGYVIASVSHEDAVIKGSSNAGGIVGYTYLNPDHKAGGSNSYVVACCSKSEVESSNPGSIVGTTHQSGYYGDIISSWSIRRNNMNYSGNNKIAQDLLLNSDHYAAVSEITEETIDKMNQAIDDYNAMVTDIGVVNASVICHYKWQFKADDWPVLVQVQLP